MLARIIPVEGHSGHPDNSLPGGGSIDNSLPEPPPGIWPPPVIAHPIVPIPPGTSVPPGTIWPPIGGRPPRPGQGLPGGGHPDQGLPGGGKPDQGLPGGGGRPDQGLPGEGGSTKPTPKPPGNTKFWIVAGIPGYGWKYVCIDVSLTIDNELPSGPPPSVDNTLPPAATPKRG